MRVLALAVAASVAITVPSTSFAQAPAASADEQFKQGREAMTRRDWKRALDLLRASQAAAPGRGKLVNIALCEEELGLFGSAMRHFQEVLPQIDATDDRLALVKKHLEALASKVATLRISVAAGAAPGTTVTLDGAPVAPAALGVERPVDPGPHVVVASAPGAQEKRYDVTIAGAGPRSLEVAPVGAVTDPTAPVVAPPPEAGTARVSPVAYVGFGVGGAGLLVAAIAGGVSLAKTATIKKGCDASGGCPSETAAIASATTLANVSNVGLGVGAAGVVLGVVGLVVLKPKPAAAAAWVEPVVGPGQLGVRGAF